MTTSEKARAEYLARIQRERDERMVAWRATKTSELLGKLIVYEVWAASGETSWAPISGNDAQEIREVIDERMPPGPR